MRIKCDEGQQLGKGGFGTVYKGTVDVAVKRVLLADLDIKSSKSGEEALLHLDHPNVIKLLYIENDTKFRYYALELCRASLDKLYLKDERKYRGPIPQLDDMLLQLASGLKYIHDQQLVHRDIKPENVLIWVSDAHVSSPSKTQVLMKWADFGLCKPTNESGSFSMSAVKGTRKWFAPEILKIIENATPETLRTRGSNKSDVFAEGLIFGYILLGGQHIFGNNAMAIMDNISKNNPVNLKEIPEEHRHLVERVIKKQLKPKAEERIAAGEVFKQLKIIRHRQEGENFGDQGRTELEQHPGKFQLNFYSRILGFLLFFSMLVLPVGSPPYFFTLHLLFLTLALPLPFLISLALPLDRLSG